MSDRLLSEFYFQSHAVSLPPHFSIYETISGSCFHQCLNVSSHVLRMHSLGKPIRSKEVKTIVYNIFVTFFQAFLECNLLFIQNSVHCSIYFKNCPQHVWYLSSLLYFIPYLQNAKCPRFYLLRWEAALLYCSRKLFTTHCLNFSRWRQFCIFRIS